MLNKYLKIMTGMLVAFSFTANADMLKFDDCNADEPTGYAEIAKGCGNDVNGDFLGDELVYNLGDGKELVVTADTSDGYDVRQDRQPGNAGLGSDGEANGDNTGYGEMLMFTFNLANPEDTLKFNFIQFNGGTDGGHNDDWNDTNNEIMLTLYDGDGIIVGSEVFDITDDGTLTFDSVYFGDGYSLKVEANLEIGANHYVEAIGYESGFGINCFPSTRDCTEVPEPNVLFLLGFTVVGFALRRKLLFK